MLQFGAKICHFLFLICCLNEIDADFTGGLGKKKKKKRKVCLRHPCALLCELHFVHSTVHAGP